MENLASAGQITYELSRSSLKYYDIWLPEILPPSLQVAGPHLQTKFKCKSVIDK